VHEHQRPGRDFERLLLFVALPAVLRKFRFDAVQEVGPAVVEPRLPLRVPDELRVSGLARVEPEGGLAVRQRLVRTRAVVLVAFVGLRELEARVLRLVRQVQDRRQDLHTVAVNRAELLGDVAPVLEVRPLRMLELQIGDEKVFRAAREVPGDFVGEALHTLRGRVPGL